MRQTKHAAIRAQQRGFPPLVDRLLDEFGQERHDGHGCVRLFFDHKSVRLMERSLGRQPVALFRRYLSAYRVETSDGLVVTKGWRTKRSKNP
jgi:hypothetical protein